MVIAGAIVIVFYVFLVVFLLKEDEGNKKRTELETHEIRRNPSISAGNYSGEKHVSGPPRCQVRS
jgi:hypothetical protein